jgi:hypothetical protein
VRLLALARPALHLTKRHGNLNDCIVRRKARTPASLEEEKQRAEEGGELCGRPIDPIPPGPIANRRELTPVCRSTALIFATEYGSACQSRIAPLYNIPSCYPGLIWLPGPKPVRCIRLDRNVPGTAASGQELEV